MRDQFLVELDEPTAATIKDLAELNRLFTAWTEQVYHQREHSETGQAPLQRWMAGQPFRHPTADQLREAFRWEEYRTVSKTALVSLQNNSYQVDPVLVGCKIELIYDPFDLTALEVRYQGKPMGLATPHTITRHAHPKAKPETPAPAPAPSTGIDYLRLIDDAHTRDLSSQINYNALWSINGDDPDGFDGVVSAGPDAVDLTTADQPLNGGAEQ